MPSEPRTHSAARRVRQQVLDGGERFWRHDDFADLSPSAVATALSRLTREGELQRTRKGVYFCSRPTVIGPSAPAASRAAAHSLRAPVHAAGLSAANLLGLSTQNPARPEYATSAGDPPTALAGSRVRTRRPPARADLTAEEGALLEVLRDRALTSDLAPAETARRLQDLLRNRERFAHLTHAATGEPPRVRAMLGALGELTGAEEQHVDELRKSLNPLSRFDFGALSTLPNARDWQAK